MPWNDALKVSLKTALRLYTAKPRRDGAYIVGISAYGIMIDGLRCNDTGFAAITQFGATGNGIIFLSHLLDACRGARDFWSAQLKKYLSDRNAHKMRNIIEFYNRLVSALKTVLPNDFVRSSLNGYPFEPWSKEKLLGRHPKGWRPKSALFYIT